MLTAKQTKFINEVSEGSSQSSAYRKAYDTSRMAPKTVWEESSRLRKHPKVAARIVELEAEKEARQRVQALSREDRILNELEDIAFGSTRKNLDWVRWCSEEYHTLKMYDEGGICHIKYHKIDENTWINDQTVILDLLLRTVVNVNNLGEKSTFRCSIFK